MLRSTFFSQTVSTPCTLFEEKGGVVRAPKDVFHKLQSFVELLHGGVCGAVTNTLLVRSYLPMCKGCDVSTTRGAKPWQE